MKILALYLLSLMILPPYVVAQGQSWQDFIQEEVLTHHLNDFFPDTHALQLPWTLNRDFVLGEGVPTPQEISPVGLKCNFPELYPTHPQQTQKEYLHAVWTHYDLARLSPSSSACLLKSSNKKFCQRATWANLVVMSDVFADRCGNLYRGYWLVAYLASDETMGTLSSKGRTFYPKANGSEGEMVLGSTYASNVKEFLVLGELLPGDRENIGKSRNEALKLGFKVQGQLYVSPEDQNF